jgi:uncharacterized protein
MKALLLTFSLLTAAALPSAFAANPGDESVWRAWRAKEYEHFRVTLFNNPFALQDATELAKGERRYVSLAKNVKQPRWLSARPAGDFAELSFDGERLKLVSGSESRDDFLKGTWEAPNGLGLSASGIRSAKTRIYVYYLKENTFKPARMPFFPFDPAAVVKAKLDRTKKNERAKMTTTLGDTRDYPIVGEVRFTLHGKEHALQAYVPEPVKKPRELFIPFKDATNGKETYGGGRYVEAELSEGGGDELTIDFNRAYHPYCLYSPHFNCPVVLSNRIAAPVKAGARLPAGPKIH